MAPDKPCPSPHSLRQSLDPDAPMTPAERGCIETHVEHCTRGCKQAIDALLRDQTRAAPSATVRAASPESPRPAAGPAVPPDTAAALSDSVRRFRLVDPAQFAELERLQGAHPSARALAGELIRRGWVSPYQANRVLVGRGPELVLGSYVVLERLGEGGMGEVYKARNWKLGKVVALKVISKGRVQDPDAVRRFQREVRAAALLDHAHLVRALDADEVNGTHLLVMEYVAGIDLAKLVKKEGPLAVEKACDYVRQAALGLQYACERGLVHRDVKPHNLLVTPQGVVKVLDVGLALLHHPAGEGSSTTVTPEGAVMGTPDYMAPEQTLDSHLVDIRADLYALGCTLYFLLAGRVPFPGGTLGEKIAKHQMREPAPVEQARPDTPPAVAAVVRKLMAKRPEDRYQTPAEAAAALEAATRAAPAPAAVARRPAEPQDAFASSDGTLTVHEALTDPGWAERRGRTRAEARRRLIFYTLCGLASFGTACLIVALLLHFVTQRPPAVSPAQVQKDTPTPPAVPDTPRPAAVRDVKAVAFERWVKETAGWAAEQQVKAVAEKLKELNPRFDGTVHPTIQGGVVIRFWFVTDEVTDISPVRALQGLEWLGCAGSNDGGVPFNDVTILPGSFAVFSLGHGKGRLADLSPLKALKLQAFSCSHTEVSDLSPLAGMPLGGLACADTKVSDLSPLTGKSLAVLYCSDTPVGDLKALQGMMPGGFLSVSRTAVSDLSPLKDMRLDTLDVTKTNVSSLSPLKGMKLTYLGFSDTGVSDLSPLQGMPLATLVCSNTRVSDLSPLSGMPLKNLHCDFVPNRDTAILRSIPTLESINFQPAATVLGAGPATPAKRPD